MNIDRIIERLTPPALAWRLGRATREKHELEMFTNFYGSFLTAGDLCFDIGANLGNRTRCFRHIGCDVVAVEPQSSCFRKLRGRFANDPGIRLVNKAIGRGAGDATIHLSPDHVLSSLSESFIERTRISGRFAASSWNQTETVEMITLDQLIEEHGEPKFIKIDVEGYESEVLAGLSRPISALSIEWTPELPENARASLSLLAELGNYEYNLCWGESMRFSKPQWRSLNSILTVIDEFEGETQLFADIYARLSKA